MSSRMITSEVFSMRPRRVSNEEEIRKRMYIDSTGPLTGAFGLLRTLRTLRSLPSAQDRQSTSSNSASGHRSLLAPLLSPRDNDQCRRVQSYDL